MLKGSYPQDPHGFHHGNLAHLYGTLTMSFGTFTVNTKTFEPTRPGTYSLDSSNFDDPANEIRIRAGANSKQALTAGVTRVVSKDVTAGDDVVRKNTVIPIQLQLPKDGGFTAAEVRDMIVDLHDFLTEDRISDILQGRS